MPEADHHDADGWARITQLAATVKPAELLELDAEALLGRLFHEDMETHGVRVYDPLPVVYHCPEDWTKVRDMIRSLGREDAETILREHGEILIRDDICNHELPLQRRRYRRTVRRRRGPDAPLTGDIHSC